MYREIYLCIYKILTFQLKKFENFKYFKVISTERSTDKSFGLNKFKE